MNILFFDLEVDKSGKINKIGAVYNDGRTFSGSDKGEFRKFASDCDAAAGHNIIHHDLKYVGDCFGRQGFLRTVRKPLFIDTLYWSPLLFPKRPYHKLVKNDKLISEEPNNPLNDSHRARELFNDEVEAFKKLDADFKSVLYMLLKDKEEFGGFFKWLGFNAYCDLRETIRRRFRGLLCENASLDYIIESHPEELAYVLAFVAGSDSISVMPQWIRYNFPSVCDVQKALCFTSCDKCEYCRTTLSPVSALKNYFGYDAFRVFDGEPLQENAVKAALNDESILVIFPTGGGKSLTFQLPALMSGRACQGLTVVISPLQSLMKDQVDNLAAHGISNAVTLNGLQNPVERAKAIESVENGSANLLYIAPESLRSDMIEKLITERNVVRFVIDEAHCFSAWGQDFRVDYQYIGKFIKKLSEKKGGGKIPVSCFTATAKQKVIADICSYFSDTAGVELKLLVTAQTRKNLTYFVRHVENDSQKYEVLRQILSERNCPTIIYAVRTRRCKELSERLNADGFNTVYYHGQLDAEIKRENQDRFMSGQVNVIVATSAFGMGVDKSDVGLVVHYDISDSLENYVQEAGRAGRNENTKAECVVLFNENDLNKHFVLLNSAKLSLSEIRSTYKAIKEVTRFPGKVSISPLDLARKAGFDTEIDAQMSCNKVISAVTALENAGYIIRSNNNTYVYGNSIAVNSVTEALPSVENSGCFADEKEKEAARRIISFLLSRYSTDRAQKSSMECRLDYIASKLEMRFSEAENIVMKMQHAGILRKEQDINACIDDSDTLQKAKNRLEHFIRIEEIVVRNVFLQENSHLFNLKELNQSVCVEEKQSNLQKLHTLLYFWSFTGLRLRTDYNREERTGIEFKYSENEMTEKIKERHNLALFILNEVYSLKKTGKIAKFSLVGLVTKYNESVLLNKVTLEQVQNAVFYLCRVKALNILDGFLVFYNRLNIERLETDNKINYKAADYNILNEFYKQRVQQIHIVGKYADFMVRNYNMAMQYVKDYFALEYKKFVDKYFTADEKVQLEKSITKKEFNRIFSSLSEMQKKIIDDNTSEFIVVAAGPGSGKTKLLVHKLASLLLLENVKTEELLMLTFSHYAALEFKERLIALVGSEVASRVGIRTFHSFAFDIVGEVGSIEAADNVIKRAVEIIKSGEAQDNKLRRTCIVIDEAQDMGQAEYELLCALIDYNPGVRVVAVGDDDQNIFSFRGSSSKYFISLAERENSVCYELLENFRSTESIVRYCNSFIEYSFSRFKKGKLKAYNKEKGVVAYCRTDPENPEYSAAGALLQDMPLGDGESAAVLCRTNEEAEIIFSYLQERGVKAKLLESCDGFKLRNLSELRFFMKCIAPDADDVGIVSPDRFNDAILKLQKKYEGSRALENCLSMLNRFSASCPVMYRSDLNELISESTLEDYEQTQNCIAVSTIHKAKGREYDRVYMLVKDVKFIDDEERRCLYVGMTRAKKVLKILSNTAVLDKISDTFMTRPPKHYGSLSHLIHVLTLHDVTLAFFKRDDLKKEIFSLKSGDPLVIDASDNRYLCSPVTGHRIVMLSASFCEKFSGKISKAQIEFIVAWKDAEDDREWAVILPRIEV